MHFIYWNWNNNINCVDVQFVVTRNIILLTGNVRGFTGRGRGSRVVHSNGRGNWRRSDGNNQCRSSVLINWRGSQLLHHLSGLDPKHWRHLKRYRPGEIRKTWLKSLCWVRLCGQFWLHLCFMWLTSMPGTCTWKMLTFSWLELISSTAYR